jgi:hypothetical protein
MGAITTQNKLHFMKTSVHLQILKLAIPEHVSSAYLAKREAGGGGSNQSK